MKKSGHIPLQHHNHTNPTNTKNTQTLSSHGYFGYSSYLPTPRGVSNLAPLILCIVSIIPRVGLNGYFNHVDLTKRSKFLLFYESIKVVPRKHPHTLHQGVVLGLAMHVMNVLI